MNELERAIMTISCADCEAIPKVSDAGQIADFEGDLVQIMHNGLKVKAGGYHGDWMAHVIRGLRGHHEPQEELLFYYILRYCRNSSLFIELGAFWCYYTMWYLRSVPHSSAICIEPDPGSLAVGRHNLALNRLSDRASFHQACVGGERLDTTDFHCESDGQTRSIPCVDMNAVLELGHGRPIEVLHMDVQGAELEFIQSMGQAAQERLVRFVVVSTHHKSISGSSDTHIDCLHALQKIGATVLAEHNVQQSYSGDGLIVASFFHEDRRITLPSISLNEAHNSLFRDAS
jgi:FkbM family methyltransferase